MKIRLTLVSLLVVSVIVFFGCEKEKKESLKNTNNELLSLQIAGVEHNEGLERVLQDLKVVSQERGLRKSGSEDILNIVKQSTFNFFLENSNLVDSSNRTQIIDIANNSFEWIASLYGQGEQKCTTNDTSFFNSAYNLLNDKQKELLMLIFNTLENDALDLDATLEAFEKIRKRAMDELNEQDRLAIVSAVEIGSNSMLYWSNNFEKWSSLFSSTKSTKEILNWRKIVGADIQGAIGGLISGLLPGAGVGAGIGALGGGLGASAGAAALQLWEHFSN